MVVYTAIYSFVRLFIRLFIHLFIPSDTERSVLDDCLSTPRVTAIGSRHIGENFSAILHHLRAVKVLCDFFHHSFSCDSELPSERNCPVREVGHKSLDVLTLVVSLVVPVILSSCSLLIISLLSLSLGILASHSLLSIERELLNRSEETETQFESRTEFRTLCKVLISTTSIRLQINK